MHVIFPHREREKIRYFPSAILTEKNAYHVFFPGKENNYIYKYIIFFLSLTVMGESSRATAYARRAPSPVHDLNEIFPQN